MERSHVRDRSLLRTCIHDCSSGQAPHSETQAHPSCDCRQAAWSPSKPHGRHAAFVMIGGLADLCKHRLPQDGVGEGSVLEQGARQDLSRQILPSVVAHAEVQDLVRHCIGLRCN